MKLIKNYKKTINNYLQNNNQFFMKPAIVNIKTAAFKIIENLKYNFDILDLPPEIVNKINIDVIQSSVQDLIAEAKSHPVNMVLGCPISITNNDHDFQIRYTHYYFAKELGLVGVDGYEDILYSECMAQYEG